MGGLFAADHSWAVVLTAGATAALVAAARLRPGPWMQVAARSLAVVLVGDEVAWWIDLVVTHANRADLLYALPFQLCDAAIFISALALWSRRQILVEVTYFWGLAGTSQAILTPEPLQHFPSFLFIQYYVAHGGVVAAALFLVVGLRQCPRRRAVLWVAGLTIVYTAFVGLLDVLTGANYMFLRAKPGSATLLDLLGPRPWYIGWAALIGIALFLILDAPFAISRKVSADRITGRVPR